MAQIGCSAHGNIASCWSFGVSPVLRLSIPLMNLFCLKCKKQPRHGHVSYAMPTTSAVPTTTALPTTSDVLTPSAVPAASVVPTASVVPIVRGKKASHPVDSEVLVQGLAPITAE